MVKNEESSKSDEAKSAPRRRKHRSETMKKFSRMTRDRQRLMTAIFYLVLVVVFLIAGYTFLFTPGSFSNE